MAQHTAPHAHSDTLLDQGRDALLAGDKDRARDLLHQAVEHDPASEDAWMWFSATQTTPQDMADCLYRVLAINPHNEQAHEGLDWLRTHHGPLLPPPEQISVADPSPSTAVPEPLAQPVRLHPPRPDGRSGSLLIEAALHPTAVGALLGLLRLVGWLRPSTLVQQRTDGGPLGFGGALGVAVVAALAHGLALVIVWLVASVQFNRVRVAGRGDIFNSLIRMGHVFVPSYLWSVALVAAAAAVSRGGGVWQAVVAVCWACLIGGVLLIVALLRAQLRHTELDQQAIGRALARCVALLLITALLGLGLAGIATAAALR